MNREPPPFAKTVEHQAVVNEFFEESIDNKKFTSEVFLGKQLISVCMSAFKKSLFKKNN